MIRVIVVDDHAVVRQGVIRIVNAVPDMTVLGEAASAREALKVIRETDCDVLLLDISLPDSSGLEILEQVVAFQPNIRTLILSIYPEKQYAIRAIRSGAAGYLTKDAKPEELSTAIRKVAQGGRYITPSLAEEMANVLGVGGDQAPHATLSGREYQVMLRIAEGQKLTEIAADMGLSITTISTYRSRLLNKLDLETNADIVRYAFQHDLFE